MTLRGLFLHDATVSQCLWAASRAVVPTHYWAVWEITSPSASLPPFAAKPWLPTEFSVSVDTESKEKEGWWWCHTNTYWPERRVGRQPPAPIPGVRSWPRRAPPGPDGWSSVAVHRWSFPAQSCWHTAEGCHPNLDKHSKAWHSSDKC